MTFFGITLETREEKSETLKRVISSLSIWPEEKDLYLLSLDILSDHDFTHFFETIMSQITKWNQVQNNRSIEPLTSRII
jgi:hypothetical protein